jgi:hypothetical protein
MLNTPLFTHVKFSIGQGCAKNYDRKSFIVKTFRWKNDFLNNKRFFDIFWLKSLKEFDEFQLDKKSFQNLILKGNFICHFLSPGACTIKLFTAVIYGFS